MSSSALSSTKLTVIFVVTIAATAVRCASPGEEDNRNDALDANPSNGDGGPLRHDECVVSDDGQSCVAQREVQGWACCPFGGRWYSVVRGCYPSLDRGFLLGCYADTTEWGCEATAAETCYFREPFEGVLPDEVFIAGGGALDPSQDDAIGEAFGLRQCYGVFEMPPENEEQCGDAGGP